MDLRQHFRAAGAWLLAHRRDLLLVLAGALGMFLLLALAGCSSETPSNRSTRPIHATGPSLPEAPPCPEGT